MKTLLHNIKNHLLSFGSAAITQSPSRPVAQSPRRQVISRNISLFNTIVAIVFLFLCCTANVFAQSPTWQATGAAQNATVTITVAWPAHQLNDVALLFVESCGGEAATLSTPAGFTAVTNSPQATGTLATGTRLTVFWCRATSSSMTSPVVADPGNHVYGVIVTFRGVFATGDPCYVTAGGVKATASTSATLPLVTTTVDNSLVVLAITSDVAAAAFASGWTNANLSSITERFDLGTTSGNDGGIAVADGGKASAGSTGTTTVTVASSVNAFMTIALKPLVPNVYNSETGLLYTTIQGAIDGLGGSISAPQYIEVQSSNTYNENVTVNITGTSAINTLTIRGQVGQSPIINGAAANGITVSNSYVIISNFQFTNSAAGTYGIKLEATASNCEALYCKFVSQYGVLVFGGSTNKVHHNIFNNLAGAGIFISNSSSNTEIYSNTFYSCVRGVYFNTGTTGSICKNNIFCTTSDAVQEICLDAEGGTFTSNYNHFYTPDGTSTDFAGCDASFGYELASWRTTFSQDANSNLGGAESDPLFVTAGTDFHEKSTFGSAHNADAPWPPSTVPSAWTADASNSPCIDAGNADPYANEPTCNGGIINQGCYGNTAQASKSNPSLCPTDPQAPIFYNTGSASQLAFNNSYINDNTPLFRASATHTASFNRFFVEINTVSTFSGGTAYTQTFSGTYTSGTQYDLDCSGLSPALPTTAGVTYYVRAKASANGGSTWSPWSTGTYSLTYKSSVNPDWFQTTTAQFNSDAISGVSVSADNVTQTSGGTFYLNDNMEYADDAAFQASWTVTENTDATADPSTLQAVSGTKSIKFTDASGGAPGQNVIADKTITALSAGTAECYAMSNGDGWFNALILYGSVTGIKAQITFKDDLHIWYYNGTNYDLGSYTVNTFYYIKIVFDAASGVNTCEIFINGVSKFTGDLASTLLTTVISFTSKTDPVATTVGYVDDVKVYTGSPQGIITSSPINYASFIGATSWCEASWNETAGVGGTFKVTVQKYNSPSWLDVTGMVDIDVSPIVLTSLTTEAQIRLVGNFTYSGGAPTLNDWTVKAFCSPPAGNAYGVYAGDGAATVTGSEILYVNGTGTECLVCTPTDDLYPSVAISGYPVITESNINCTAVDITYSQTVSAAWNLGAGATNPTPTGTSVITQYTTTGRKDIVYSGNTYSGFQNISMAAPSAGTVLGIASACAGIYNYASSEAGSPGFLYAWTCTPPANGTVSIASPTASSTNITFTSTAAGSIVFPVTLVITTECCGALTPIIYNVTINPTPVAPTASASPNSICPGASSTLTATAPASCSFQWYDAAVSGNLLSSSASYIVTPAVTTSYYVQATTASGCIGTRTMVTVTVTPTAAPATNNGSSCGAGDITVSISAPVAGYTYNWYTGSCGLTLVQSSTVTSYTAYTSSTTTYWVSAIAPGGCNASVCATATATVGSPPATINWLGVVAGSNNWFNTANWTSGCLPTCVSNVSIPDLANDPDIGFNAAGAAACKDLNLQSNAVLSFSDTKAELDICGNFTHAGILTTNNNGKVVFMGTVAQTYTFTGTGDFNDVILNNTAGTATLTISGNMSLGVIGNFTFQGGKLITGADNLIIKNTITTAMSGYSSTKYCEGNLRRYISSSDIGAYDFPVGHTTKGYQLANVNFTAAPITLTYLTANFQTYPSLPGPLSNPSECNVTYDNNALDNGFWQIDANNTQNNTGVYNMTLFNTNYTNAGTALGWTIMSRHNGSATWALVNGDGSNGTCAISPVTAVVRNGMKGFSKYGTAQSTSVLPIELLVFNAICHNDNVYLNWSTASETNNDYFTVERSSDGINFQALLTVDGAGNSNQLINYSAIDENPLPGIAYYRLKQTDFDGKYEYSRIIVACNGGLDNREININVFPNPAYSGESVFLDLKGIKDNEILIVVVNTLGEHLYSKVILTDVSGFTFEAIDPYLRLTPGIYHIIGSSNSNLFHKKLVIR